MNNIPEYLYRKASINKIPLNGTFELSPVCNFSCKMCYVRKTTEQIKKSGKRLKDWQEWLEFAKECKKAGMLYLLLTGGEPFVYPGFKELYEELHKMGFLISINTNGTLINKETIDWLKDRAPHRINITLYGTSGETYEQICGNYKGYELAKNAILMLKEAGIQVVINASMIPQNEKDMEEIIRFGNEHNVFTRVSTYMFPPIRREAEEDDSRFTSKEAAAVFLRKQRCVLSKEEVSEYYEKELAKVLDTYGNDADETWGENLEYMRCRAGRSTFWVSWEGEMTACGMIPFPVITYPFERPFYECWLEVTNRVRSVKVLEECNKCNKKGICNPCVAMIYTETGEVNCKAPYVCEMVDCIISGMRGENQNYE